MFQNKNIEIIEVVLTALFRVSNYSEQEGDQTNITAFIISLVRGVTI
jgi:hypothetical protein